MARALRPVRSGIRSRLLAAFALVAVPPLLVLAVTVTALVSRSFERAASARLETGLRTALARVATLRRQAEERVRAVAAELPGTAPGEEASLMLAGDIARRRDLQALELVDAQGRVISSHHWPAGFGLKDEDGLFEGDPAFRIERVATEYGMEERLALMPAQPAVWRGVPVIVRGGVLLDGSFLADLSGLMGAEVALRDGARGRWIAPAGSPLAAWGDPPLPPSPSQGDAALAGTSYQWASAPLQPRLWMVVATPRSGLDAVKGDVRRAALAIAGASLLAALAAALVLSGRIARPVRELAAGARRVTAGDLTGSVEVATGGEIGDLAGAFNAMTAELRASRERLLQTERVAAWREMARRLAHELKNPIFPIQLSIETLRRAFGPRAAVAPSPEKASVPTEFEKLFRESCDTILEELTSLREIIEEFSAFARMPQPQLRPTDVNAVLEQVLGLYQARAAGVAIEKALAPDLVPVPADRELLARALGNLVANALDAMPQGGTLTLRTSTRPQGVAVEVDDTGPGLTEDQRTRLFTPYYTTKKGGTGLGLAIVQSIVSDHGGSIEVRSEPGRGTSFTLILPASPRPSS